MKRVTVLAFDNCYASSVTSLVDVFNVANQLWLNENRKARPLFTWRLASADGGPVETSAGLRLATDGPLPDERADVVCLPSFHYGGDRILVERTRQIAEWCGAWLVRQHAGGAWVAAGCSGTFVLARTGLLDGRAATTSWWLTRLFRREFPRVGLRSGELITEDARLLCAGPGNAHFNLGLRVVERVAGPSLALLCAKALLVDANRPSQLPYMVLQTQARHTDDLVLRAQEWMRRRVGEEFGMDEVAREAGMSQRNFIRRFKRATGVRPSEYLQNLRVETAKHLLETTDLSLEAVVERVGYGDASAFRRLFKQLTTLSPREYRQRFALGRPAPEPAVVPLDRLRRRSVA